MEPSHLRVSGHLGQSGHKVFPQFSSREAAVAAVPGEFDSHDGNNRVKAFPMSDRYTVATRAAWPRATGCLGSCLPPTGNRNWSVLWEVETKHAWRSELSDLPVLVIAVCVKQSSRQSRAGRQPQLPGSGLIVWG